MCVKRGIVRLGADPTLRDELHDGDPTGWPRPRAPSNP